MNIAIIGAGYVGLVSAAGFADFGLDVICIEKNEEKLKKLDNGDIPFFEPGLLELVNKNRQEGRLRFSSDLRSSLRDRDVVFLAVGTPMLESGGADLRDLISVGLEIIKEVTHQICIVVKSTVPVGTSNHLRSLALEEGKSQILVASNPEFLKEGDAVNDFLYPDRVILGVDDRRAQTVLERLYEPLVGKERQILVMDTKSAELAKYAANAMLATRISFMNELSRLCEKVGANIECIRKGIGSDSRIGKAFLHPGIGYGGSCFPKDIQALMTIGRNNDCRLEIIESVDKVNKKQKMVLLEKLSRFFKGEFQGKVIAVWGLAFKPRTDDIREAPALDIINALLERGALVRAYDRAANLKVKQIYGDRVFIGEDEYSAAAGADALLLLTEWAEFKMPDWTGLIKTMQNPAIFDGRNIYNAKELRQLGFYYEGIGIN